MNDPWLAKYDELYVVSDLHLGGQPGFQIFKQGPRLGKLIRQLAKSPRNRDVGLVLNGDTIDSLAAPDKLEGYIAVSRAGEMMDGIYEDPAFKPVWEGLAAFVRAERRRLILVVGNHDIELALPQVEYSIRNRLAGDDPKAQARIVFATRGTGYACMVGNARVYCTHGNEKDGWNAVDHEALRDLTNKMNAGRAFDQAEWKPNAGTRLVINVMNQVKRRHPFIDLLKPEKNAAIGVLLTLDPAAVGAALDGLSIVTDRIRGELVDRKILSAEAKDLAEARPSDVAAEAANQLLGASLREAVGRATTVAPGAGEDDVLLAVEEDLASGRRPLDSAGDERLEGKLGWFRMVVDRIRGIDKVEALRRALQDWMKEDNTFDLDNRDDAFKQLIEGVGPGVNFLITGHTHLERAMPAEERVTRYYYNSGTWVRIIRLTGKVLSDPRAFRDVYARLSTGKMENLDGARIPAAGGGKEPLILDRSTVVRVSAENNGVVGRLLHAVDGASGDTELQPVENTEFWRR
jgi:UDP-2,3-diacylglucosamine pyrophosphatase LpxH